MSEARNFTAHEDGRLDRLVASFVSTLPEFKDLSRSQIKHWIEGGMIDVNGAPATKAGTPVKQGDRISVRVLELKAQSLVSFDTPLDIVYEDDSLLVINKQAGLSMHPGAGNNATTLVNALLGLFRARGNVPEALRQDSSVSVATHGATVVRPGIVHRLDKDTTGLVVVAKTLQAHTALAKQFAERSVGRRYVALAFCTPRGKRPFNLHDQGKIDAPLLRHATRRKEMTVAPSPKIPGKGSEGKKAITHWKVIERLGFGCLVEARLETGRTHQIRIHFTHIGCPLIGDKTYGEFSGLPLSLRRFHEGLGRQALHAGVLAFSHPVTGERLSFSAEIPADMREALDAFRKFKLP
jgi:23S rRNA pseudouridine1911/1915/1917 synthase